MAIVGAQMKETRSERLLDDALPLPDELNCRELSSIAILREKARESTQVANRKSSPSSLEHNKSGNEMHFLDVNRNLGRSRQKISL